MVLRSVVEYSEERIYALLHLWVQVEEKAACRPHSCEIVESDSCAWHSSQQEAALFSALPDLACFEINALPS